MSGKSKLLDSFNLFRGNGGGIENWFSDQMPDTVVNALLACDRKPISCEEFNQLLILSHEAGVSRAFFKHYFCSNSYPHGTGLYDPIDVPHFEERFLETDQIISLEQLKWGLYRLYIDCLLIFGSIRQGFRRLRSQNEITLRIILSEPRHQTDMMLNRGDFLPLESIAKDDRYLIAEMACKTYAPRGAAGDELVKYLEKRRIALLTAGRPKVTFRDLISGQHTGEFSEVQLAFSLDEVLDDAIANETEIARRLSTVIRKFAEAREKALTNTSLYLSMISDMDVYVATSMRSRTDFRMMADFCDDVFSDTRVADLKLRYFDPTMSAAIGHEDKGLIECLMVKCAPVLVYNAGERESYGKDVEAAMALSLGKPVIFYCDSNTRANFYREIHPLARLINFETGVACGAIVTDNKNEVAELLSRIFKNKMQYEIDKKSENYFALKEKITNSTVRLQTDDILLRETFWNYYNRQSGLSD